MFSTRLINRYVKYDLELDDIVKYGLLCLLFVVEVVVMLVTSPVWIPARLITRAWRSSDD